MTLRATKQYVEILTDAGNAGFGELRVTKQYVEVLQTVGYVGGCTEILVLSDQASYELVSSGKEATDTLSLGDTAAENLVANRSILDTLVLSDSASVFKSFDVSATDTLILLDASVGELVKVVHDTLVLSDNATTDVIRVVVDTLSLGEVVGLEVIRWPYSEDTLILTETVARNHVALRKSHDWLSLGDTAVGEKIYPVSDTLILADQAVVDRIVVCSDILSLSDSATLNGVYGRIATDSLTPGDSAETTHEMLRSATDTLSLGESSVGDYCRVVTETLSLSDAASYIYVRPAGDTLSLQDEAGCGGSIYHPVCHDWLSLIDEAQGWLTNVGNATDILSLTDQASVVFGVVDALSLNDVAEVDYSQIAYDTLSLSDLAGASVVGVVYSIDTLELNDTASVNFVRSRHSHDQLALKESNRFNEHRVNVSDVLQLTHVNYNPITQKETITYTGLQDQATAYVIHAQPRTAEDHLSFAEQAVGIKIRADAISAVASDSLTLLDRAYRNYTGSVTDSFVLNDAAAVVASKLLVDTLNLTDEASYNINRNSLVANDTLELSDAVSWYSNQLDDYLYIYHPFVGTDSVGNPTPPDEMLTGPIPGITDPFKLVYPVVGPFSDTLILRAPNLGNRDRLQMNRISRETRGGSLVTFADPIWPKIQKLVLDFSGLTWAEASGLCTFMDNHLGLEIGVLDWEHRFWKGIIIDLSDPIVQDGPGCKYTVGFEFEGELATYQP